MKPGALRQTDDGVERRYVDERDPRGVEDHATAIIVDRSLEEVCCGDVEFGDQPMGLSDGPDQKKRGVAFRAGRWYSGVLSPSTFAVLDPLRSALIGDHLR